MFYPSTMMIALLKNRKFSQYTKIDFQSTFSKAQNNHISIQESNLMGDVLDIWAAIGTNFQSNRNKNIWNLIRGQDKDFLRVKLYL